MIDIIDILKKAISFEREANEILGTTSKFRINNSFPHNADIGVITSTIDEFNSIKKLLVETKEYETNSNDSIIYYIGNLKSENKNFRIVLPFPISMGVESTVISTTKLISSFKLKYIFMVGISAGNKNITKIGDILIAERSLNYNQIVEIENNTKNITKKFMQNAGSINQNLKSRFTLFANSNDLTEIKGRYSNNQKFPYELNCHIGLLVSGSSLLRSGTKINEINESYHGVIGLDMETNGFYFAASNVLKDQKPYFASIKSVSDFGDESKHNLSAKERKSYALHTSSSAFAYFVLNHLK